MSYKLNGILNILTATLLFFELAFILLAMMFIFGIPVPTQVVPYQNLSIAFFVEPGYMLLEQFGIESGVILDYALFIAPFAFVLFVAVFTTVLGFRHLDYARSGGMTIFVELLHAVIIALALMTVILYLSTSVLTTGLLVTALIVCGISLLSFLSNICFLKSSQDVQDTE